MNRQAGKLAAMLEQLRRSESFNEVLRVRLTEILPKGLMVIVPLTTEEAQRYGRKHGQELLVHPEDWERFREHLGVEESGERLYGVPVER